MIGAIIDSAALDGSFGASSHSDDRVCAYWKEIPMIRKTLILSVIVAFSASAGALACGADKSAMQSMKPTTLADGGQSVPASPSPVKTQ